jgi:DNA-binding transcriptional ArsR family regulator
MVVGSDEREQTDLLFHALSDATRRDIVTRTLVEDHSVTGLTAFYDMSFAAVQKHVAVLEKAGLVTKHRHGRERLVRGNADAVRKAHLKLDELETVWRDRIDRMGKVLDDPENGEQQ